MYHDIPHGTEYSHSAQDTPWYSSYPPMVLNTHYTGWIWTSGA